MGLRSQEKSLPRTRSSGEDQEGKRAGPLEWSIRGAADRSPGLVHPGKKASGPELGRPGLNKKEEWTAEINYLSAADARTRSRGTEDQQGRASQLEIIWATGDKVKDRATPTVRRGMKTKTREESMGPKRGQDKVSQAEQEGEDSPHEGAAGGESQTPRTGWNIRSEAKKHEGGPLGWTLRRAAEPKRANSTGCIFQERSRRQEGGAPRREHSGGRRNAAPDWIIRGGRRAAPGRGVWVKRGETSSTRSTSRGDGEQEQGQRQKGQNNKIK